jgi:hypothetical protein
MTMAWYDIDNTKVTWVVHFSYTCHTVVESDLCLAIMIDTVSKDIAAPINVSTTRI